MTNLLQTPQGHYTGWRPSPPDPRDITTQVEPAEPALNDTYDPRGETPPILNQLELGACTANATMRAIRYAFMQAGADPGDFSRLWAYAQTRYHEGGWDQFAQDSGAYGRDDFRIARHLGLVLEDVWPYDISKFNDKEIFQGVKKTISPDQRYFIDQYSHPHPDFDTFRAVLKSKKIIAFGFNVYESFESAETASTGIVTLPQRGEKLLGGHEIAIEGYTWIKNQPYFICPNNWGTEWGDDGYCYFPVEYMFGFGTSDFRVVDSIKTQAEGVN